MNDVIKRFHDHQRQPKQNPKETRYPKDDCQSTISGSVGLNGFQLHCNLEVEKTGNWGWDDEENASFNQHVNYFVLIARFSPPKVPWKESVKHSQGSRFSNLRKNSQRFANCVQLCHCPRWNCLFMIFTCFWRLHTTFIGSFLLTPHPPHHHFFGKLVEIV